MSPRPNPTQHTAADEREFRQLVREYAPGGQAVDKADLVLAFSESNQRSWANVIRRAALDWVLENMPDRFIVRPGFAEELRAYLEGTGDLPADAAALRGDDQVQRRFQRAAQGGGVFEAGGKRLVAGEREPEEIRAELAARAHEGAPDADGRYPGQEPRGRFARADDPGYRPDRR